MYITRRIGFDRQLVSSFCREKIHSTSTCMFSGRPSPVSNQTRPRIFPGSYDLSCDRRRLRDSDLTHAWDIYLFYLFISITNQCSLRIIPFKALQLVTIKKNNNLSYISTFLIRYSLMLISPAKPFNAFLLKATKRIKVFYFVW